MIRRDFKEARLRDDTSLKDVTKMLLSELEYAKSALGRQENLDDSEAFQIIGSYYKSMLKKWSKLPSESPERDELKYRLTLIQKYLAS